MEMARSILTVRIAFLVSPASPKHYFRDICDAEFVKVHTIHPFPLITWLLIITDVDDGGQVITPRHLVRPRIGVSRSLTITYVYGPEPKVQRK